jgi:hypothetical protein
MQGSNGIVGTFDYAVNGAEKLSEMDARLASLEKHLSTGLPQAARRASAAHDQVAHSQRIGGEQAAKYLTTAGLLSGGLQKLGVQNEMVGRSFSVFGDLLYGVAGPAGAIMVAAGAVVALTARLVEESKAQENAAIATDKATDALIRQKNQRLDVGSGGLSYMSSSILLERRDRLSEKLAADVATAEAMLPRLKFYRDYAEDYRQLGNKPGIFASIVGDPQHIAADMTKKFDELIESIEATAKAKRNLDLEFQQGPPIELMRTDFSKEEAARAAAPRTAVDTQVPFSGVPLTAFNENIQQAPGKMGGTSVSDLVGIKNPFTQHTQAVHDNTVAYHNWAEESSFAIGKVLDKHGMLSAGIMSLQTTTSKVIETALMRENWHRLKGVEVAKYAAGMTASALIGGIRDYAAAKVGQNIAQAVEWLSNPMTAALAPGAFASAAKWSLVAGVSGGVSAALASGASKGFDKSLGNPEPAQVSVVGGSSDVSSSSNPGVRIANSGASVGTINYNFIVTYQGATVYGDGGTRDWFQRELVPLINEGISAGSISRN